ncbi:thiol peroxidase [bacterium]|nr:thiol peroxidase [bacterium]MBU2529045.1 thiol peroxidase [bacterium]
MKETKNIVTMNGQSITLVGNQITVGSKSEKFNVLDDKLNIVDSSKFDKKIKVIASVPSLDTPICELEIKRFNDEAAALSKDVIIIFISMDLPFAQARFNKVNSIKKVKTYSDHKDIDFGLKYGVLIKEHRLLARAIFIIDKEQTVQYVEYVDDITHAPNYDAALSKLRAMV